MADVQHQAIFNELKETVSATFGISPADLEESHDPTGGKLEWTVAGTSNVGEWYTVVVVASGVEVKVEHWYCTVEESRSDYPVEFGPFDLSNPTSIEQIEKCLAEISRNRTFLPPQP